MFIVFIRVVLICIDTGAHLIESAKMLYDVFIPKLSMILIFFGFPVVSFRANTLASRIFIRLNDTLPLLLDSDGVPNIFPSKIEYESVRPVVSTCTCLYMSELRPSRAGTKLKPTEGFITCRID